MSGLYFDDVLRRWVLDGGDDRPRMAIPDNSIGYIAGLKVFVATLAATVAIASLGGIGVGTLKGVIGVEVGDTLIITPKTSLTLPLSHAAIPTTDTINLYFSNPLGAVVNQGITPAYDVLVVKKSGGNT